MTDFLTVEDINTIIYNAGGKSGYHLIDTSKISSVADFTNIKYDFVIVSREKVGNNFVFTFEVKNNNWGGAYCCLTNDDEYISTGYSISQNGSIVLTTTETSVKLILYCSAWRSDSSLDYELIDWIPTVDFNNDLIQTYDKFLNHEDIFVPCKQLSTGDTAELPVSLSEGLFYDNGFGYYCYYYGVIKRTTIDFTVNNASLVSGKTNKIILNCDSDYLPGGDLIDDNHPVRIKARYDDELLNVYYDSNVGKYCFDLDLSDKVGKGQVRFSVVVYDNKTVNYHEYVFIKEYDYEVVSTLAALNTAIEDDKVNAVRLGADITLSNNNLNFGTDMVIYGDNHKIVLSQKSIIVDDCKLVINDCTLQQGDPCFTQEKGSEVILNNCKLSGHRSTMYGNLGSSIYCNIDINSLDDPSDFKTSVINCSFITPSAACEILHGGELLVDNCKFHCNTVLKGVVQFLYQVDGVAVIRNSVFDIDGRDTINSMSGIGDYLCTNQKSAMYGQALFMCGETATINGARHEDLQADNSLPFFDAPYNNQAHVFLKYYYPQITACVFASPLNGKEDKNCCHAVSGLDWVFKNNTQITRASAGTENTTRKIVWED